MNLHYVSNYQVAIDSFGLCRDGSFTGLISEMGVSQRDIIKITIGSVSYAGIVTKIASPLKSDIGTVSTQSLIKRLKEVNIHKSFFKKVDGSVFTLQELVQLLLDDAYPRLNGAILGFTGLQGATNIKLYTPNAGSLYSNLSYLASLVGMKVLGVNGQQIIVFGADTLQAPGESTFTVGSTTKSTVVFNETDSEEIVNSVGVISGWTTDDGRVREQRIGTKVPIVTWFMDPGLNGSAEKVFQLTPKSIQYERVPCEYSLVTLGSGQTVGFASGGWKDGQPPALVWDSAYDGNLDTAVKLDGNADVEPSIAIKMKIAPGQKVDGFFIAGKDEPKMLWSMVKGDNSAEFIESLISEGYRADAEVFPKAWSRAGTHYNPTSGSVDISGTNVWLPNDGVEVVGDFVSVTIRTRLSSESNFSSQYDSSFTKQVRVPTSGQEVRTEFVTYHGFNGAVEWKHGVVLRYSASANNGRGAIVVEPFGNGGKDGVLSAYWTFSSDVTLQGFAMTRVLDKEEKNTPDYATLKGYILAPIENDQGITIVLVWKNPGWISPYFPSADVATSSGGIRLPGRFIEALTLFELYPVRINNATISEFAKTRMRSPAQSAATLTCNSQVIAPVGKMTLNLPGGNTFTEVAKLFTYSVSRNSPTKTVVQLGQDYNSNDKAKAAILINGMQESTFDAVEFSGSQNK